MEQWNILNSLRNERKKYGKEAANRFAINNSPMEFEAYLHEGESGYLETRKPFAYKQYETKAGRSEAVWEVFNHDINQRLHKVDELSRMINTKKTINQDEVAMINILIKEMLADATKLRHIRQKYGKGDWELISTFKTPK